MERETWTMKKVFKWKRVAIDFDGTLVKNPIEPYTTDDYFDANWGLAEIPGAKETTAWLRTQGFEILVFTCRQDYQRAYIEKQLREHHITWDYIVFYAKPHADLYIDDKGFRFVDWNHTREWIKNTLRDDDMNGTIQEGA